MSTSMSGSLEPHTRKIIGVCENISILYLTSVLFIGSSCTAAALAGGITLIGAMPNTNPPITNENHLKIVQKVLSCCSLFGIMITLSLAHVCECTVTLLIILYCFGPIICTNRSRLFC